MSLRRASRRGRIELSALSPGDALDARRVWNSVVVHDAKVAFVNVSKNASTSLKWLMAELAGKAPEEFHHVMGLAPTRQQTVHRRASWADVPKFSDLTDEQLGQISPENGWFVFAVVRDPRLRVWSAWQSKFLVGNPRHTWHKFQGAPWLPRVPRSADDVVEDFATFVRELEGADGDALLADTHFRQQTKLLRETEVPYSHLYETSELSLLLEDLHDHLAGLGITDRHTLTRENETPLSVAGRVFTSDVIDILDRVYASDLERFGDRWTFGDTLDKNPTWAPEAFRDISARVAAGQRIADLARGGEELQARVRELERKARADRRTIEHLSQQVAAMERRTLRGFPRAVASRVRGNLHREGS